DSSGSTPRMDTVKLREQIIRQLDTQRGLTANWIRKIVVSGDQIWAATFSNGIMRFKYDLQSDEIIGFKRFGRPEGMENVLVADMRTDGAGRLWYATKNG